MNMIPSALDIGNKLCTFLVISVLYNINKVKKQCSWKTVYKSYTNHKYVRHTTTADSNPVRTFFILSK